jgi:hypothetical protein
MDADPNLHFCAIGPVVLGESTLTCDCCCHSFVGPAEGDDEAIALRANLAPAVLPEGRAEQPVVLREQITVPIAQPDHQPSRALDVAEQQRDGATGQIRV